MATSVVLPHRKIREKPIHYEMKLTPQTHTTPKIFRRKKKKKSGVTFSRKKKKKEKKKEKGKLESEIFKKVGHL